MGLTLAEIMLLIIFALLLVIGRDLVSGADDKTIKSKLIALFESLGLPGASEANDFEENFRRLTVFARAGSVVMPGLVDPTTVVNADEAVDRIRRQMTLGRETQAAFGPNRTGQKEEDAAREFVKAAGALYRDQNQAAGPGSATIWLNGLQACKEKCGGGGAPTSCVFEPDGSPSYIYDATLNSGSIQLKDNNVAALSSIGNLPPVAIEFGPELSMTEFLNQTRPLFDWSKDKGCRFYVKILDQTAAAEKSVYKQRLRTVGQHFYHFEPLGDASSRP